MVNKTIFWCIVFRLESTEKGFLGTENLHSTGWMFGQVKKTASMANKAGSNKLSHESGEIGGYGVHAITEVLR